MRREVQYGVFAVVSAAALAAAFYAGMRYDARTHKPVTVVQVSAVSTTPLAPTPTRDDPAKRLQLDNMCGQSATQFASEHELKGLDTQNTSEHSYNAKLGKCFVLLQSFFKLPGSSAEMDWLHDAADGTNYGVYRIVNSIQDGNLQRVVNLCATFPDGKTQHLCSTEQEWKTFVDAMMHPA